MRIILLAALCSAAYGAATCGDIADDVNDTPFDCPADTAGTEYNVAEAANETVDAATCCIDVDECLTDNGGCATGADCTNANASGDIATCACPAGTATAAATAADPAQTCSDVDECLTANGGCDANADCTNGNASGDAATCVCQALHFGDGQTCTAGCAAAGGFADTANGAADPVACGAGWTGEKTNTCTDGVWGTADEGACVEVVDPVCTCPNGTKAEADGAGADQCTADGVHCTACQAYAEAEADDNDDDTTEEPEKAGFTLTVVQEVLEDDNETVKTPWSSTCVAYSCTCWDPVAVNADDLVDDAQDGLNADGKTVANSGTEDEPVWGNGWAAGNQTAATGIWCTEEGGDICVADPPKCGADYTCGTGWTIIADAATTEGATDAECCTEDESESESVDDTDADKKMECTCAEDAATTCADAVKELAADADKAACEAVDGGAWTEVKEAEDDEDDASSAAMASAVVALVSLLL